MHRCYVQAVPTVRPPSPSPPSSAYAAGAKGDFPLWKPAGDKLAPPPVRGAPCQYKTDRPRLVKQRCVGHAAADARDWRPPNHQVTALRRNGSSPRRQSRPRAPPGPKLCTVPAPCTSPWISAATVGSSPSATAARRFGRSRPPQPDSLRFPALVRELRDDHGALPTAHRPSGRMRALPDSAAAV